ncbi:hypothetical protein ElyMa_001412500 [Elysia marginata]|uniref:Uncharacterized protein n=1 Tax=Elysia marginata TaxID=1093978 RepID=A0AAV4IZL5_9GAST|nr:hypothetical protein ElyMa_001412500 [Elysia marginata]
MTDSLAEIQELNQVQKRPSDGSDIEDMDHFSNADDFSEDGRRYLDAIGREIESMDHMEALRARGQAQGSGDGEDQDPELDAEPQVQPNCPDLNAQANWITENFVQRGELDCQCLTLGMGVLKLPGLADYWRTTKRIFLTQFGSVMSRVSFQVYTGREAGQAAEHGLAHRVVKDVVAPYHR